MGMKLKPADRIAGLPPYLFAAIDQMKQEAIRQGKDIINLGVGDPDLPTPPPVVRKLQQAAEDPKNHQYPSYEGLFIFRQAVSQWYQRRFGVALNPENEVQTLIGSKEGIGHFPLAFINPGDIALIPTPGYPVYHAATLFAGGRSFFLPLLRENQFLPDLSLIPPKVLKSARILFINYPNNPTSATATAEFFKSVVSFAERNNLIVCHDAAYSEIYFDGKRPESFLSTPGAKDVGIEFHSLSKTFNMTGWRIGFAVGNREVLSGLGKVKSNLDSGVFQAIQEAGVYALSMEESAVDQIRKTYQERRDVFVTGLRGLGFDVSAPQASFYVWVPIPRGTGSAEFTALLLAKTSIVSTPGKGFGEAGEGYIRLTLTVRKERLAEAIDRIEKAGIRGS